MIFNQESILHTYRDTEMKDCVDVIETGERGIERGRERERERENGKR